MAACGVQSRDTVIVCLTDGGIGGDQQLCAVCMASTACDVQRRLADIACLIDVGIRSEQQLHAICMAFTT